MSGIRIEATSKGLTAIRELVVGLGGVPLGVIDAMIEEVKDFGILAMQNSIAFSTGEKSTGQLLDSIEGEIIKEGNVYRVIVGSNLAHSLYAASNIAATRLNRNVQVMPGRWRFIGIRPPIPAHPFLMDSVNAMVQATQEIFPSVMDQEFYDRYVKAKEKEGESP